MSEPTPVQLQILRQKFPGIGEPGLRHNWEALLDGRATTGKILGEELRQECQAANKKRLRQSSKPLMNALETRFYHKLSTDYPGKKIHCQAVRLELARNHWYKPDFFLPGVTHCYRPMAYEVKGPHAFRGGFENLKVAARVHQWIAFFLVWEDEQGGWKQQEILP